MHDEEDPSKQRTFQQWSNPTLGQTSENPQAISHKEIRLCKLGSGQMGSQEVRNGCIDEEQGLSCFARSPQKHVSHCNALQGIARHCKVLQHHEFIETSVDSGEHEEEECLFSGNSKLPCTDIYTFICIICLSIYLFIYSFIHFFTSICKLICMFF